MSFLPLISGVVSVLPTISKWLGNDESKAKKICDIAKKITNTDDDADALSKIINDPTAQLNLLTQLKKQDNEFYRMQLQDTENARQIQMKMIGQKSRIAREFIYWFAGVVTLLTFLYIFAITFIEIPSSAENYANTTLGFLLGTAFGGLVNFFYGSSKPVSKDD